MTQAHREHDGFQATAFFCSEKYLQSKKKNKTKHVSHYWSSTRRIMENIEGLNISTEQNVNINKHGNVKV